MLPISLPNVLSIGASVMLPISLPNILSIGVSAMLPISLSNVLLFLLASVIFAISFSSELFPTELSILLFSLAEIFLSDFTFPLSPLALL